MKNSLIIVFTLFIHIVFSQNLEWAKHIGNESTTKSRSISSDNLGNLFCIGRNTDTVDFNPNSGITTLIPGYVFISKYSLAGNLLWAKSISKIPNSSFTSLNFSQIKSATDDAGNLYIASTFKGTIDFDPGPSQNFLSVESNQVDWNKQDFFILKLDPNGNFIWVKHLKGDLNPYSFDFELDNNKLYLAASFMGTIDLDPSIAEMNLLSGNWKSDMFVSSYTLDGSYIGHQVFESINFNDIVDDMTIGTNGAVYISGSFSETANFPNSNGTVSSFDINNEVDNFLLKITSLTEDYGCDWVKQLHGDDFTSELKILAKSNDELLLYGTTYDQISLDFNDQVNSLIDIAVPFFANYNSDGNLLSFHKFPQYVSGNYITLLNALEDNEQNLIFSGIHRGTVDIDLGTGQIPAQSDSTNLILMKYDQNAQYLWHGIIQNKSNYILMHPLTIFDSINESIYLTTSFNGMCDFDPNIPEFNIEPSHIWPLGGTPFTVDMAIIKLNNSPALQGLTIQEQVQDQAITVYPNPTESNLKFENLQKPSSFVISDILGNIISQGEINPSDPEINIQDLVKGVYILKLENYGQSKFIKK